MTYRAADDVKAAQLRRPPSGDVLWAIFRRSDGKRIEQVYADSYVHARELAEKRTGLQRDELNILWIQEGSS
jgi:hypothetical protein